MVSAAPVSVSSMDGRTWQTFQKSFNQVQSILDQNRLLIEEINQNHESKVPACLTRNVILIRELNNNISKVVGLYAGLSSTLVDDLAPPEVDALKSITSDVVAMKSAVSAGQKRLRVS